jgi:cobalt-zinc-cadmium efflux system protein
MANHQIHQATPSSGKRLALATVLNLFITVAEVIGGILGGSLALLSDAMHNFSDAVALVISGIAIRLARQPKTNHYTFGLKRAEILAAALTLLDDNFASIVRAVRLGRRIFDNMQKSMLYILAMVTGNLALLLAYRSHTLTILETMARVNTALWTVVVVTFALLAAVIYTPVLGLELLKMISRRAARHSTGATT